MKTSKRAAVAISGLMFVGAALTVSAAGAEATTSAPRQLHSDDGGGGGGGGGTNFVNPNQNYVPQVNQEEHHYKGRTNLVEPGLQ